MKKIIHYIFIVIAFIFVINIIQIISLGFSNLSEFGYGALAGKLLLLLISIFVAFKTRIKKLKNQN